MPKVIFMPAGIEIIAPAGKTLLDIAFENDIVIEHNCGGLCACTSCKVIVLKGFALLNEKSSEEIEMLESEGYNNNNIRLSCQCRIINESVSENIIIEIPRQSL